MSLPYRDWVCQLVWLMMCESHGYFRTKDSWPTRASQHSLLPSPSESGPCVNLVPGTGGCKEEETKLA